MRADRKQIDISAVFDATQTASTAFPDSLFCNIEMFN